ncbi:MAG: hypothetical protein JWM28_588 [Chitinophagaceae bacterium]|nr:hypothetical protein [Chitinophagaceae bacterium]
MYKSLKQLNTDARYAEAIKQACRCRKELSPGYREFATQTENKPQKSSGRKPIIVQSSWLLQAFIQWAIWR